MTFPQVSAGSPIRRRSTARTAATSLGTVGRRSNSALTWADAVGRRWPTSVSYVGSPGTTGRRRPRACRQRPAPTHARRGPEPP
jgi:hypothetical protein